MSDDVDVLIAFAPTANLIGTFHCFAVLEGDEPVNQLWPSHRVEGVPAIDGLIRFLVALYGGSRPGDYAVLQTLSDVAWTGGVVEMDGAWLDLVGHR